MTMETAPTEHAFKFDKGVQLPEDEEETTHTGVKTENVPSKGELMWQEEIAVRRWVEEGVVSGNFIAAFFVNMYSALHIFAVYLISLDSLLSIALSVGMTIYTYDKTKEESVFDGAIMDWVLLSFAVITPMSASIGMAFARREQSLVHIAVLKTTLWSICSAHACWDWVQPGKEGSTGRKMEPDDLWIQHHDKVLDVVLRLCTEISRLLTLPNSSRTRHRVTSMGKREARKIQGVMTQLQHSIYAHVHTLTYLCEELKVRGLPAGEATRIRQFERFVTERIEMLIMIKKYRTPQALRSFARLFSVFLPPFYAPFYGQMGRELNSLAMGVAFSALTAIALTALFESISQMEDPFVGIIALDGIDVENELGRDFQDELLDCRRRHYPHADKFHFEGDRADRTHRTTIRLLQAAET